MNVFYMVESGVAHVDDAVAKGTFGVDDRSFLPSYQYLFDAVHPDDQAKLRHQISATLEDEKPYRIAFRIVRPDGSERMLLTAARLERSKDGHPGRLIGACQDVTGLTQRPAPSSSGKRKS